LFTNFFSLNFFRQVEYGHFKRRDNRDFRDRDRGGDNRDRGGDNRDRGGYGYNRDRGDNRDRGYNRDRGGDFRDRGGFRDRGDFRDRGGFRDREDRDMEESVFSKRVRAGKRRTYFLDVKKTRGDDYFITITESTRREDGYGYKRHKIFLYKEDFNRFVASLNEVVNHVKTELMPDFDYEEFDRRQAEWEAQNRDFDEDDDRSESRGGGFKRDTRDDNDFEAEEEEFDDEVKSEKKDEEEEEAPPAKKSRKKKDDIDEEDDWKL